MLCGAYALFRGSWNSLKQLIQNYAARANDWQLQAAIKPLP